MQECLNKMNKTFLGVAQCFWSNSVHFKANLGSNRINNASEVELYIILAMLNIFFL